MPASSLTRRALLLGAAGAAAGLSGCAGSKSGAPSSPSSPTSDQGPVPRGPLWRIAYERGIVYGASISTWMYKGDPAYAALFRREAALLWPEDDMLWYRIKRTPTSRIDFTYPDRIVEFAEKNHQLVLGGPGLVWDQGFGKGWADNVASTLSPKQARDVLFGTLRAMVRRYRGRVRAWIVCNEVTSPMGFSGLRTDVPWYTTIGSDYVADAFRAAREEDPHAFLMINEFGLDTVDQYGDQPVPRQKALLQVIDNLQHENVPLDGVGIQAHLLSAHFEQRFHAAEFRRFLHELAQRGLKILITEMDVLDYALPKAIKPRDRGVADIYRRYLDTALQEEAVIAVVSFGLSDKWSEEDQDNPRPDKVPQRPLPFDRDFRRKPDYDAIARSLAAAPKRAPAWQLPPGRRL